MRYTQDIVIPAGTPAIEPHVETVYLAYGLLENVMVRFRAGCHNMVNVALFDGLFQLIPATPDSYLYGDNQTYSIPMQYPMTSSPYPITVKAWCPLTLYDHVITIWCDINETYRQEAVTIETQLKHLMEIL